MNPGRYFIPNMHLNPFIQRPINYTIRNQILNTRSSGLLNKIINGIKTYNWKSLLSGANKTLNVVNQTIPLIRQAKPMVNNVKSMVQLAKAFGNETNKKNLTTKIIKPYNNNNNINNNNNNNNNDNDYPTFFI